VLDMHQKAAKGDRGTDVCAKELQVTRAALLRYRGAMAGVVRSVGVIGPTVEDVVHDAFEMACRKAEAERPDPRDDARFGGWLCTLARYAALTSRNDTIRNREISSPSEDLEGVPEASAAYIGYVDDKIAAAVVFANLNADDRALLHQHFYEDKTVQELATERGVPWTTMRSRLDGVILRARAVMDDPSARRRPFGASLLTWLMVFWGEIYVRLHASWARSKRIVAASTLGFVSGGAVVAMLFAPSMNGASYDVAAGYASFAGEIDTLQSAVNATSRAVHYAAAGAPSGLKSCSASSVIVVAEPVTVADTIPSSENVEDRSRAMVPWGVSAVLRDHNRKRK
jgi:DNA-directed RNA polymerase specialized sigma24 family protein